MAAIRVMAAFISIGLLATGCAPSAAPAKPVTPPVVSAGAPAAAAATDPAAALLVPLRLGLVSQNAVYWLLYVAAAKGFARQEHLDLEFVQLGSGPRVVQATVSQSVDIALASPDSVVPAAEQGADLVMIAGNINKPVYGLIAVPGTRSLEDLRGKTLGATSLTTGEVVFLKTMLARHALEMGRDYDVVVAGGAPERLAALKSGVIVATVLIEPQESMLMAEGYPRLARAADYFSEYQFHVFIATRSWLAANEDVAVRFIKALIRAGHWLNDPSNREEAAQILNEVANVDLALARSAYDSYVVQLQAIPKQAELSIAGTQAAVNTLGNPAPDASRYIDLRYHEKALAALR